MPFITSSQTLSQAWEAAQNFARQLKGGAQAQRAAAVAGNVPATRILHFQRELRMYRDQLDAIAALPGIAAYVGTLADTPSGYNVSTEFAAMKTQIVATYTWIQNNFPASNGYLLERTWGADGPVDRIFSVADLTGYVTQLDALLASLG